MMLSDEEINKGLEEAMERYAKKEIDKKRAKVFYILGTLSGIAIALIITLIKKLLQ